MKEDIAAGLQIGRFGAFGFVVTESSGAGNEDHRGGDDTANLACVMSGTRHHVEVGVAEDTGSAQYRFDAFGVETHRRVAPDLVDPNGHTLAAPGHLGPVAKGCIHFRKDLIVRVAEVDSKPHRARNGVARVGKDVELADRGNRVGRVIKRYLSGSGNDSRGGNQRVVSGRQRR